jgi:hypothetical protein
VVRTAGDREVPGTVAEAAKALDRDARQRARRDGAPVGRHGQLHPHLAVTALVALSPETVRRIVERL